MCPYESIRLGHWLLWPRKLHEVQFRNFFKPIFKSAHQCKLNYEMTALPYVMIGKSRAQNSSFLESLLHHVVVLLKIQYQSLTQTNDLSDHFVWFDVYVTFYLHPPRWLCGTFGKKIICVFTVDHIDRCFKINFIRGVLVIRVSGLQIQEAILKLDLTSVHTNKCKYLFNSAGYHTSVCTLFSLHRVWLTATRWSEKDCTAVIPFNELPNCWPNLADVKLVLSLELIPHRVKNVNTAMIPAVLVAINVKKIIAYTKCFRSF